MGLAEYGIAFGIFLFAHDNGVSTRDLSAGGYSLTALHSLGKTQMLHQTAGFVCDPCISKAGPHGPHEPHVKQTIHTHARSHSKNASCLY
jgi:hypothetical protein